jgi:hypothetical protein
MAKLSVKQIQELARKIVAQNPGGIRFAELKKRIAEQSPETYLNTIGNSVVDLATKFPHEVAKPSRGLYVPAGIGPSETSENPPTDQWKKVKEEDFYEPFAEYLKGELDEATIALTLGGAGLQKKWGTPDVVGVYKPLPSDRIKFDIEIIAAEIKIVPQQPVVAFGQAAAYRLFAAKSYVVMPATVSEEDYSRLEALCMLFGIGFVQFAVNVDRPEFTIKVRAQRFPPDMFYVNQFAERMYQIDPSAFNTLFG